MFWNDYKIRSHTPMLNSSILACRRSAFMELSFNQMGLPLNSTAYENPRLAHPGIRSGYIGASLVHELLLAVQKEIWRCNNSHIRPTKKSKEFHNIYMGQMWMDLECCTCIPEVTMSLHKCSHFPVFRTNSADHSSNSCKQLLDQRPSQPLWPFRYFQTGHVLLSNMLRCRTELRHIQSGAHCHPGHSEVKTSRPRGSEP